MRKLPALLSAAMLAAAMAGGAPQWRFEALVCVAVDARCPHRAQVPGLALAARGDLSADELLALVQGRAANASAAPAGAAQWLVALGPLQAEGARPGLRGWASDGQRLVVDVEAQPYSAVGDSRRRGLAAYPVLVMALPEEARHGAVQQLLVRWWPAGGGPLSFELGPLALPH